MAQHEQPECKEIAIATKWFHESHSLVRVGIVTNQLEGIIHD